MRTIKFRAWSRETRKMMQWEDIHRFGNLNKLLTLNHVDVMQFTGLLDKNGREIYEGDILKGREQSPYASRSPRAHDVVIFMGNGWKRESYNGRMIVMPEINYREMEVIGNVHENPELLKL